MSIYGLIPTDQICRFGELTKTQIIVVSYLYACRNTKTGKCNPSQIGIAKALKLHRSHVSRAISGLKKSGWLAVADDGFLLPNPQHHVTKSATSELPNPQHDVTNLATNVTNHAHTHLYINREEQRSEHREPKTATVKTTVYRNMDTIQLLIDSFPETQFTPAILGHIESGVGDSDLELRAWRETVDLYRLNHDPMTRSYNPLKIGTVLEVYRKKLKELQKDGTSNKSYRQERADEAATEFERIAELRKRVAERNRELSGKSLPDSVGQLQLVSSITNSK